MFSAWGSFVEILVGGGSEGGVFGGDGADDGGVVGLGWTLGDFGGDASGLLAVAAGGGDEEETLAVAAGAGSGEASGEGSFSHGFGLSVEGLEVFEGLIEGECGNGDCSFAGAGLAGAAPAVARAEVSAAVAFCAARPVV